MSGHIMRAAIQALIDSSHGAILLSRLQIDALSGGADEGTNSRARIAIARVGQQNGVEIRGTGWSWPIAERREGRAAAQCLLTMSVVTHILLSMERSKLTASEVFATCVCLGVQRAARGVARRYDEALRPAGITSGQFTILSSLLRDEPTPIGSLAKLLGLDRTTLNRNLRPLEEDRLIATVADSNDARVRRVQLTATGRNKLDQAIPLWRKVQSNSNDRLGKTGWQSLRPLLMRLG